MKKAKKVKRQPYYCETRGSWVIPITQGRETLVDAEDVEFLGQFNWRWNKKRDGKGNGYALLPGGQGKMHRILLNNPEGMLIDHINGNSLDNRKLNLRVVTNRENQQNRTAHRDGKLLGSCFHIGSKKWQSVITIDKKLKHLGLFKTEHEAHQAYMKAYNELDAKEKSAA